MPPMRKDEPITALLHQVAAGDKNALDRLVPLLYPELQKLARSYFRSERAGHTLQPTALVHEAYERLVKQDQPDYSNRAHFMAVAAQIMRQVLIDHARVRNAQKRGGGAARVTFTDGADLKLEPGAAIIAVDDALTELAKQDPLKAQLIELRFFGGMTAEDSAEALNMNLLDVRRHLRIALAWLQRELDRATSSQEKK
jgi:RNA polymerase sigma factor (TIGR02999 family)